MFDMFLPSLQVFAATAAIVYIPYLIIQLRRERSSFLSWKAILQVLAYELILCLLSLIFGIGISQLKEFPGSELREAVAWLVLAAAHWWVADRSHSVARKDLTRLGLAPPIRRI